MRYLLCDHVPFYQSTGCSCWKPDQPCNNFVPQFPESTSCCCICLLCIFQLSSAYWYYKGKKIRPERKVDNRNCLINRFEDSTPMKL
ncbi:hypothetical protein QQP08_003012 [Theobroma cacao]|nr:hypothetical protein QQP08_003012 [Theobroma cacao]